MTAILVCVDVEAVGASPVTGTMTEFGAVALTADRDGVGDHFHGVLVEARPDPDNPAVPIILPGDARHDASAVMAGFASWLDSLGERVVFVSDNPLYDGMWIWAAFDAAGVPNPFGHSGRRISDFAAGLERNWGRTQNWKRLRRTPHTHNPVDDSRGNAEALVELLASASRITFTGSNPGAVMDLLGSRAEDAAWCNEGSERFFEATLVDGTRIRVEPGQTIDAHGVVRD